MITDHNRPIGTLSPGAIQGTQQRTHQLIGVFNTRRIKMLA